MPEKTKSVYRMTVRDYGDGYVEIAKKWRCKADSTTMVISSEAAVDLLRLLIKVYPLEALSQI